MDDKTYRRLLSALDLVENAVRVYAKRLKEDSDDHTVECVVQRLLDEQSAVCWGVDCVHVAKYLDKDYDDYVRHQNTAVQILMGFKRALDAGAAHDVVIFDTYMQAATFLKDLHHDYEERGNVPRPQEEAQETLGGSSEGVVGSGSSAGVRITEEDTLP